MAKKDLVLGIDIGSYSVKICQLARSGKKYQILALGSAILPDEAVSDGSLEDAEEVSKVINLLIKNLKLKNRKVAFSISGYSVIVKKINIAAMSRPELEAHIDSEAEQYIPFDIDDVYLDYQDLHTAGSGNDMTDVMLVAAKKDVVDRYIEMLAGLKLTTKIVDVDSFAFENAYEFNYYGHDNVALIDIGASKMNINILSNGISVVARDVLIGSNHLTDEIADNLGIEFEEAEEVKLGIRQVPEEQDSIEDAFSTICTKWVLEIKKAIDIYQANNPSAPVERIVLGGGGSKVVGLTDFLAQETGLKVERFNPFANLDFNSKKMDAAYLKSIGPEMAIATGIALRSSVV